MAYVVGQDDRLGNIALVLLAQAQACLTPRCFKYTGVFPGPPVAPCDVLAVYLDPVQPLTARIPVQLLDPEDFPCFVPEFVAHYVIHIQRCCAIPPPTVDALGNVTNWLDTSAHTDAAFQLSRDLMSMYQCLQCTRESLFGTCAPMRVGPVSTTLDSCYVHKILVDIVIPSDCCAATPCPDP